MAVCLPCEDWRYKKDKASGENMRFLGTAVIVASLAVSPLVSAQPLSPGKPAGVREARHGASTGVLIAGGVLVAGLVAVLAYTNSGNNNGVVVPSPSTTTP
jgi:hypothetical protein